MDLKPDIVLPMDGDGCAAVEQPSVTFSERDGVSVIPDDSKAKTKKKKWNRKSIKLTPAHLLRLPSRITKLQNEPHTEFRVKDFVERVNCHVFADWYGSKSKPSYVFWAVMVFATFGVATYYLFQCFLEFYTNPIQTTVRVTYPDTVIFPDVTICPTNFIDYSRFSRMSDEGKALIRYFRTARHNGDGLLRLLREVGDSEIVKPVKPPGDEDFGRGSVNPGGKPKPHPKPNLVQTQKTIFSASFRPENFIRECSFRDEPCSALGIKIFRVLDISKGVCYRIKLGEITQNGPTRGLKLVIDLQTESQLFLKNIADMTLVDGVTVRFERPHKPVSYAGILATPGQYYQMSLSAKYEKFISVTKFSQTPQVCNAVGETSMNILSVGQLSSDKNFQKSGNHLFENELENNNTMATKDACDFDCLLQQVITNPTLKNCLLPVDLRFVRNKVLENKNLKFCTSFKDIEEETKRNASFRQQLKLCRTLCQVECQRHSYKVITTSQKLSSVGIVNYYSTRRGREKNLADIFQSPDDNSSDTNNSRKFIPYERWESNIIILDIAFDELSVTSVIQSPAMTTNTFLSNLGGIAGLWLGASLFTLLQAMVFVVKFCVTTCKSVV